MLSISRLRRNGGFLAVFGGTPHAAGDTTEDENRHFRGNGGNSVPYRPLTPP